MYQCMTLVCEQQSSIPLFSAPSSGFWSGVGVGVWGRIGIRKTPKGNQSSNPKPVLSLHNPFVSEQQSASWGYKPLVANPAIPRQLNQTHSTKTPKPSYTKTNLDLRKIYKIQNPSSIYCESHQV